MAFDAGLAERIREALAETPNVTERKMFGGLAFMVHGYMFVGIVGNTLMARVGADYYPQALKQKHVREMDFTGKPMKGYVYIAPAGFETDNNLAQWIERCRQFVSGLPPK